MNSEHGYRINLFYRDYSSTKYYIQFGGQPYLASLVGNIQIVENHYGGKYLGYFCQRAKNGQWTERAFDTFYQPNPDFSQDHSHFFCLYARDGSVMIADGRSHFEEPLTCVIADDGELVFSRFRHDYRGSQDGSVFIDGGKDYFRGSLTTLVTLEFKPRENDDLMVYVPELDVHGTVK